ncbi:uncharacterized protein CDAR_539981 [Caerostris darwini]|uniref:Cuticle protein n=1 Tax=Caerostris darwini TaxID=1538125 RepID=A0AAV4TIR0_9ARAC|nr:uncharacterized protein CDAR_539981 [Caerostris darwini]
MYGYAQEVSIGQAIPTNSSVQTNGHLFTTEAGESDIWLLTKDSPIPARLNRAWSPENGYPGVQHVSTLRRIRGPQSPIDILEHRSENNQGVEVFTSDSVAYNSGGNNRQTQIENIFHSPEAVLVQLPAHLTSGFWENPRPQFMEQLSSSARRVGSSHEHDFLQFDGISRNEEQKYTEIALPAKEHSDRIPNSSSGPQNESILPKPVYDLPYQTYFIASDHINNEATSPASLQSSQQDSFSQTEGRASSVSPVVLPQNEGELLYEISYDELLSRPSSQEDIGLTLTKDDVEILEKLGILSALNLETFSPENVTSFDALIKNSQREYENRPELIDNDGKSFTLVPEGRYDTNLSDVVLIEVPEFLTSEYYGNIPGTDEQPNSARPVPYIVTDSLLSTGNESNVNEGSSSYVYNASSLTPEEIQEIFELLGLSFQDFYNNSSSQTVTSKVEPENITTTTTTTSAPNIENTTVNSNTSTINIILANVNNSITSAPIKTSMSTSVSRSFLAVPSSIAEKLNASKGLVSSGRIQPRLLDSDKKVNENEILQMISRRISPISSKKLEVLRKLKLKPKPYVFGYRQDDGNGTHQHRNETADGSGIVKGTYGYRDASGVYRNVNYIADNNGFHAVVRTNEPGTITANTADAVFRAELPPKAAIAQMMAYANARSKNIKIP